jgi:2-keto-4-pentenoate hydratase
MHIDKEPPRVPVTMLTSTDLAAIAARMQAAWDNGELIRPFSSQYEGLDMEAAYVVAHQLHLQRLKKGDTAVGRKIGFTNPDMWPLFGVKDPVWGHLYESTVIQLEPGHQTCSLGSFFDPKIEPEIIVHFKKAPPAGADVQAILACVDWISHGFEIAQCHFPGWQFKAPDTIIDRALNATLLVGERWAVADLGPNLVDQLQDFSIELSCNAVCRESGRGANVLGNPLQAVVHLAKVLAGQLGSPQIEAGELVTTGSVTKAYSIGPGETWTTSVQGIQLPGLSVEFTA